MDQRQLQLLSRTQRSYQDLTAAGRRQLDAFLATRWNSMESWRAADMVTFMNAAVPAVLAGERQMAQLTNAYLASMDSIATGRTVRPAPLRLQDVTGATLRDRDPSEVYRRPAATLNRALAGGATMTAAVTQGLGRLRSLASMDMQLARTHTMAKQGRNPWFRRTLTGSENCALCAIASTQRYTRGNLMPIHPGCDCGVAEEHTMDPGQIADPDLLQSVQGTVSEFQGGVADPGARLIDGHGKTIELRGGSTRAADYTDLIITRRHGEYGPTLSWRSDRFTGPADIAA